MPLLAIGGLFPDHVPRRPVCDACHWALYHPGGMLTDPTTSGYSSGTNHFSDLGRAWTRARLPKKVSVILFIIALVLAGGGAGGQV